MQTRTVSPSQFYARQFRLFRYCTSTALYHLATICLSIVAFFFFFQEIETTHYARFKEEEEEDARGAFSSTINTRLLQK